MSEPFGLDDAGAQPPQSKKTTNPSACNVWGQVKGVWNTVWHQNLYVKRRGQTVVQLPLALAVILAVLFPHIAAVVLVIGIVVGYSFVVAGR